MQLHRLTYILVFLMLATLIQKTSAATWHDGGLTTLRALDSISGIPTDKLIEDGERFFAKGEYESALRVFTVICRRYDESVSDRELPNFAMAFNRYGNILYKRGAYSLAMDSYLQMRRIAEDHNLGAELTIAYVRIGNIYAASGDYASATDFYRKALEVPQISENKEDVYQMALNNLFASSLLSGNLSDARKYLDTYRDKFGGDTESARHKFDISLGEGLLALESGDDKRAIRQYRIALNYALENQLDPLCEGSVYSCLGEAYKRIGNADSSIYFLNKAKNIAQTAGNGRLIVESLRDIANFYEGRHMSDSANYYKSTYLNLADSISYQEEVNKLKSSQMHYELDKSEFTIRGLNADKRTQATVIWVIAVAAAVCVALVIMLLRQNRKLKAAWKDLYERSSRQLNNQLTYQQLSDCIDIEEPAKACQETDSPARKMVIDSDLKKEIATAILHYMDCGDGYCAADFSLERLSSEIGYNPRYVSEVINVAFQKNFRTLLNEYRVRKAMMRLQDVENYGNYTIKAISESVGYKSQATFISVFTKITGLKPGIYQKLSREKNSS